MGSRIDSINTEATYRIDTVKGKIDKTLSGVDTLISIFDNEDKFYGKNDILGLATSFSADAQISPFALIMEILKRTGKEDEVIDFITRLVTATLPAMETAVKAAILANVKGMISCASDPFIPKYLRKADDDTNSDERGFFLNVSGIDFNGMLKKSPFQKSVSETSEDGSRYYFGIHDNASVFECARAVDFNAYLWYCMHKSDEPAAVILDEGDFSESVRKCKMTLRADNPFDFGGDPGDSIWSMVVLEADDETAGFIPGTILKQKGCSMRSICVKSEIINGKLNNMFVPVGTFRNGCNWYIPDGNLIKTTIKGENSLTREYNREHPICNIEYVDKQNSGSAQNNAENRFKFTILPKPYTIKDGLLKEVPLLFDSEGNPSKNGTYSVMRKDVAYSESEVDGKKMRILKIGKAVITIDEDCVITETKNFDDIRNYLTECYKGLTIYEFNYDFVMGMRLFDPKVVTAKLIDMLSMMGIGGRVDFTDIVINERVIEIIRSVMEADDYTSSDCYFNFSNERYDAMMAEAEMRRYLRLSSKGKENIARDVDTESVYNILSEYDEDATLEENASVIKRAITAANITVTGPQKSYDFSVGGYASINGNEIGWDILSKMVENIAVILCEAVVTPKVVMLLEVNRKLMNSNEEPLTVESFLRMAVGLIIAIVKQIRDMILEELLKWVEVELAEIIMRYAHALAREQAEAYIELLRNIKETCGVLMFGTETASRLTNVNYADIDNNAEVLTAKCE